MSSCKQTNKQDAPYISQVFLAEKMHLENRFILAHSHLLCCFLASGEGETSWPGAYNITEQLMAARKVEARRQRQG